MAGDAEDKGIYHGLWKINTLEVNTFTTMDYQDHYERLVLRAPRTKPEGIYTEGHHVIPRCMGGQDKGNIVFLTAREHYVAHQLLVFIFKGHRGVIAAAKAMIMDRDGHRVNCRMYGWLREKWVESRIGVKLRESHKKNLTIAQKGRRWWNKVC